MTVRYARRSTPFLRPAIGRFTRGDRGAAATELALWAVILILPILSVVEVGNYIYQKMQLQNAAQSAAQAALVLCNSSTLLPAATNCTGLNTTLATAAQSTSLSTRVNFKITGSGRTTEGYYCAAPSGALTQVGTLGDINPPSGTNTAPAEPVSTDCSGVVTGSTLAPGDYLAITVYYTYTPLFSGVSVAALLPATIQQTAWMRLA